VSDYYRIKILFDYPDEVFCSTDTYGHDNAQRLAMKIASQVGPGTCVAIEHVTDRQEFWGEASPPISPARGGE